MLEKRDVPQIRFSGFTDPWEQRKFSDFAQRESTFQSSSSEYPSIEYEDVVAEEGRLNKDVRKKEIQKKGIAFDGTQVLYGKLRPYLHNWLSPDFTGVAAGDWWVLRPVGMDKKFLYRLIQTQQFDKIANQSSGSKMPRADWNLVSNTEFVVPVSLGEQRQIAETFDSLDSLITLHQRKCDKLVDFKKSMLEKMFPKEGEVEPEIRFSGFTDPWEQRKLGELFSYERPDAYIVNDEEYDDSNPTPVLTANKGFILGYTAERQTHKEPCVIFDDFTLNCKLVTFPFMVKSSAIKILHAYDDVDLTFAYERLCSSNIEVLGHARHYINVVQNTEVAVSTYTEQRAIGKVFSNLNSLITLHQRKLEMLKKMKQAMLEKMFV
ncbi:restriction endonuclease subunit S [Atopobium fossor]|uniref:restriction endonuclease subunit S n=1 Tax=Atopobium fossor TaxID=39487 RepID=UPI0003FA9D65|nr:restriction endonuclease subunit S [Atopobium fossor]